MADEYDWFKNRTPSRIFGKNIYEKINPSTGKPYATRSGHRAYQKGGMAALEAELARQDAAEKDKPITPYPPPKEKEPKNILEFMAMILGLGY